MHVADVVTSIRFPLAIAIAVVAMVQGDDARALVVVLALVAGLTDVFDGPIARRAGTDGDAGARLDSGADFALTLGLCVALAILVDDWPGWVLVGVASVVLARLGVVVVALRRRRPLITHTRLNKAAGLIAWVAVMWSLLTGSIAPEVTLAALVVATAAALAPVPANA